MGMVGLFLVKKTDGTIPGYDPHDHGHEPASGSSGSSGSAHEH